MLTRLLTGFVLVSGIVFGQQIDVTKQIKNASTIDVKAYGALGNGTHDDTAAIQAAVNACPALGCVIHFPAGTFKISSSITHGPNVSFQGTGRGSISYNSPFGYIENNGGSVIKNTSSAYTFVMQLPAVGSSYQLSTVVRDLFIDAKNGIKWNYDESDVGPLNIMLGGLIENVYFRGRYCDNSETISPGKCTPWGGVIDPNRMSAVEYSLADAKSFGVGINISKIFNTQIRNNYFASLGLGVECYACENTAITNNRFNGNGRLVHYYASNLYPSSGNMNLFADNEAILNNRRGAVRIEAESAAFMGFTTIENNYFENYCAAGVYVQSTRDTMTTIRSNRITIPLNSANGSVAACGAGNQPNDPADKTPFLKLNSLYGTSVYDNRIAWSGESPVGPAEFGTTYFEASNAQNIYKVYGNSELFDRITNALTGKLGVLGYSGGEQLSVLRAPEDNPMRHSPGNIRTTDETVIPFTKSATLSPANTRYVINPSVSGGALTIYFYPRDRATHTYKFRLQGRRLSGSAADSVLVKYVGTADTTLFTGALGFTTTADTETREVVVTIPAAEDLTGHFEVQLSVNFSSTIFEYEVVEFVPVGPTVPFPVFTYATLPTVSTSQAVTCSDCSRGTVGATCSNGGTGALAVAIRTGTGPDVYTWKCF